MTIEDMDEIASVASSNVDRWHTNSGKRVHREFVTNSTVAGAAGLAELEADHPFHTLHQLGEHLLLYLGLGFKYGTQSFSIHFGVAAQCTRRNTTAVKADRPGSLPGLRGCLFSSSTSQKERAVLRLDPQFDLAWSRGWSRCSRSRL
ncbi:hypothetical protein RB195_006029 [Necator americanus]|uniref:Uncharacterized protein n=1 Tax=Necator americanus TaxID=51031 RepID=A0ABR1BQP2_NECAM